MAKPYPNQMMMVPRHMTKGLCGLKCTIFLRVSAVVSGMRGPSIMLQARAPKPLAMCTGPLPA